MYVHCAEEGSILYEGCGRETFHLKFIAKPCGLANSLSDTLMQGGQASFEKIAPIAAGGVALE